MGSGVLDTSGLLDLRVTIVPGFYAIIRETVASHRDDAGNNLNRRR